MNYTIRMNEVSNPEKSVKAFVTVTFEDCFKVCNIAVVESREGSLFVSMPSFKSKKRTEYNEPIYKEVCNPITGEFRTQLYGDILALYEEMKETGLSEIVKEAKKKEELKFAVAVSPFEREGSNTRGLARIYLDDSFVISNVSILQGKETEFIAMPSYAVKQSFGNGRPSYQDVCYPTTKEFREKISNEILTTYRQEKEKERRTPSEENVPAGEHFYEVDDHELPLR